MGEDPKKYGLNPSTRYRKIKDTPTRGHSGLEEEEKEAKPTPHQLLHLKQIQQEQLAQQKQQQLARQQKDQVKEEKEAMKVDSVVKAALFEGGQIKYDSKITEIYDDGTFDVHFLFDGVPNRRCSLREIDFPFPKEEYLMKGKGSKNTTH